MMFPRVKPEHAPYRLTDSRVRIGGDIYGIASEIEDPGGLAWAALNLMDGTRTQGDVVDALAARFPEQSVATVTGIVNALVRSGHVEDANSVPDGLTSREQERYLRNRDFFRWVDLSPSGNPWDPQLRLKRARVVVIGLGGTGSHAVWSLAACGVGRIHCVDSDTVELSNLNRQILYTEADIGRRKVDVAVRRLSAVNSDITVTGECRRIDGEEALAPLVAGCDVLALCADEPRGEAGLRSWVNRACLSAGICWVGGGYSGPLVTTCVIGPQGPCFECLRHAAFEERRRMGRRTSAEFGWPGVLSTTAALSGQLVAQAVISLLTRIPVITPGYLTGLNVIAPEQHFFVRPERRDDCDLCSF